MAERSLADVNLDLDGETDDNIDREQRDYLEGLGESLAEPPAEENRSTSDDE